MMIKMYILTEKRCR